MIARAIQERRPQRFGGVWIRLIAFLGAMAMVLFVYDTDQTNRLTRLSQAQSMAFLIEDETNSAGELLALCLSSNEAGQSYAAIVPASQELARNAGSLKSRLNAQSRALLPADRDRLVSMAIEIEETAQSVEKQLTHASTSPSSSVRDEAVHVDRYVDTLRTARNFAIRAIDSVRTDLLQSKRGFWIGWIAILCTGVGYFAIRVRKQFADIDVATAAMQTDVEKYGTYLKLIEASFQISELRLSTEESLNRMVAEFSTIAGWTLGHALLPTQAGGFESTKSWYAVDESHCLKFRRITESIAFHSGEDLVGEALATQSPIWYERLDHCLTSRRIRVAGELVIVSGFAFPIVVDGDVKAVLEFFDVVERSRDERLVQITLVVESHLRQLFEREQAQRAFQEQNDLVLAQRQELFMQQQLLEAQQDTLNDQRAEIVSLSSELERRANERTAPIAPQAIEVVHSTREGMSRDVYELAARRFEELFHGIPVACFSTDTSGAIFEWNSSAQDLWGYIAPQVLEKPADESLIHAENAYAFRELNRRVIAGESIEQFELECVDVSGRPFWVLGSVFPTRSSKREITGAVWSCIDISARREMEERLRVSEARFRTSIESMQAGVILLDESGHIELANPKIAELLWMTPRSLTDPAFRFEQLAPCDLDMITIRRDELPHHRALRTGETIHDFQMGVRRLDGGLVWLSASAAPIVSQGSTKPNAVVMSFIDIGAKIAYEQTLQNSIDAIQSYSSDLEKQKADLAIMNAKLEDLATTDGLTRLKNHRAFQDFLEHEYQMSRRHNEALSVILLDVDHFKQFNDSFGHPAGDDVLREVAELLREQTRNTDLAARYGGEEFVLVLPRTASDGAMEFAERLRQVVEGHKWRLRPITVSLGVATLLPSMNDRTALVAAADQALYASKQTGRNKTTHFSDIQRAA